MDDLDHKQRMSDLEARIAAMKAAKLPPKRHQDEHYSQAQHAWRMVIELVAGLGIGFGIGWGLDAVFGTQPWLLVLFTLLGFAAGVNVMIRTARELQDQKLAEPANEDERTKDGD
ncbi:AtpZ/AtpI family protein [Roseivivax sp. CAU 1753]